MRIVETLIVRDEADIVGAQIAYHLSAGIDFVIASDHESRDGTTEILESYARRGYLRRISVSGELLEAEWRTRMARLAATEHGADWVIAADADEFWMPRHGTIREILTAVPARFGMVGGAICHFVPRLDSDESLLERMTIRLVQEAPMNDPTSPWRQSPKVAHRADPDVVVLHAAHRATSSRLDPLPGWYPFDVLHFPCRSREQWARKTSRRGHADADKPLGQYVKGLQAQEAGRIDDVYSELIVDARILERGLAVGALAVDTRLRDRLRLHSGDPSSGPVDELPDDFDLAADPASEADHAAVPPVDVTSLYEAWLVRLQRRLDDADARVHVLEGRPSVPLLARARKRVDRLIQ